MRMQTFRSFDEYASALRYADLRLTALGRDRLPWQSCVTDVGGVLVRAAREGSPCLYEAAIKTDDVGFVVCVGAAGKVTANGTVLGPHSVMLIPDRSEIHTVSLEPLPWFSVLVPAQRLFPGGGAAVDRSLAVRVINPGPVAGSTFHRLLEDVARAAQSGAFESNPLGQREASERLVAQARDLLQVPPMAVGHAGSPGRHRIPRVTIIRLAQERIEQDGAKAGLHDLATAAGVSARTLHNAFREQFGISPKRFLRVRLLNAARRELRRADPEVARVTDVAARLGIWEWGRFARDYRALFGELPGETLRRS